ncbi:MAG: plasmid pRiA4b ORF-3 family protein [Anaerolineae bacterium]|nr:plasmid pRiA4b ORF-3 family protein [Anaerolineae bacterium]
MKTYTLHVALPGTGRVWRKIEMRADQTLQDLHAAIQKAFGWDADHLYSFFMSGRAWDNETEYCMPEGLDPYGYPIPDMGGLWPGWVEGEEDDADEEGLTEADAPVPGAPAPGALETGVGPLVSEGEFVGALMEMVSEGKSVEEIMAEALRLTGESPETVAPHDLEMIEELIALVQGLTELISPEDLEMSMFLMDNRPEPGDVRTTKLEDLGLRLKQEFMYLFDYGDEWRFKVRVHAINPDAPEADDYPRVVETVGEAPKQYPYGENDGEWDEEEWEDEEWDDEEWEDEEYDDEPPDDEEA